MAEEPPNVVAKAFIEKYYCMLQQSPEMVNQFYDDSSVLTRPGSDGLMYSVTTMQSINEEIISKDYKNFRIDVLTIDAQISCKNGLFVFVTGCLTGKDNLSKKFAQLFFLAPQEDGYLISNDILKYVNEHELHSVEINFAENCKETPLRQHPDTAQTAVPPVLNEKKTNNENGASLENGDVSASKKIIVADPQVSSSQNGLKPAEEVSSNITEDAPKMSYAVMLLNGKSVEKPLAPVPVKSVVKTRAPVAPKKSVPRENAVTERKNAQTVKDRSIHIKNLPFDGTFEQLEAVFKQFGPIKQNGIQVRGLQNQRSCYGFVEFESSDSAKKALEASFALLGDRKIYIQEKKEGNKGSGNFPPRQDGTKNRVKYNKDLPSSDQTQTTNAGGEGAQQNEMPRQAPGDKL